MATGSRIIQADNRVDLSLVPLSDIELGDCSIGMKDGKPAVFFSAPNFDQLAAPLKFTLLAKFLPSSVDVDAFRQHVVEEWGLNQLPIISSLDSCLIVIKLQNQADFQLAWTREETVVNGTPYRLLKWHKDSAFGRESPIVPVWITLEKLPLDFCYPSALEKIAEAFGAEFIKADLPTLTHSRASFARICVEWDVTREVPKAVWLGYVSDHTKGFWQALEFEKNPCNCVQCGLLGHVAGSCEKQTGTGKKKKKKKKKQNVASPDQGENTAVKDMGEPSFNQLEANARGSFDSFEAMYLREELLRGIYAYGFWEPSVIQRRGIVPFCMWHDIILQVPPGIDKTSTLCCGILDKLDYVLGKCQALVLAPHRHLAEQIGDLMHAFGDYLGVKVLVSTGGSHIHDLGGYHVVVGTPNCVLHMMQRDVLRFDHIKMFVLSDADELLFRNFSQIYDIVQLLPPKIQVGVCSSTMEQKVLEFTRKFMKKPVCISFELKELIPRNIEQFYVDVEKEEWKLEALNDIYESLDINRSIIFVNTTSKARWLTDKMRSFHHIVSSVHDELDCGTIDIILQEFRSGVSRVLIATEFSACYVDVRTVSLVINYDLPTQYVNYLHSVMRASQCSILINFVTTADRRMLLDIERFYDIVIPEGLI